MSQPTIIFRANASRAIGTGHVMRLLALAEKHRTRGGESLFAVGIDEGAHTIARAISDRGFGLSFIEGAPGSDDDYQAVAQLAIDVSADAVVVDGYDFPAGFYQRLRAAGLVTVALDDLGRQTMPADILVNPNFGAERIRYAAPADTVLLCGSRYAMLRPEFSVHPRSRSGAREPRQPLRVLVSFGGSDPSRSTARILRCLPAEPALVVTAVVGAAYRDDGELERAAWAAIASGHVVEIARGVTDMSWPMAVSDAAICAAGSTIWELSYMGCPTAAYIVADNQERIAAALLRAECIAGGQWLDFLDDAELTAELGRFLGDHAQLAFLRQRLSELVDGLGAGRILRAIYERVESRVTAEPLRRVA